MSSTKCAKCAKSQIVQTLENEKKTWNKYCKCYGRQCPGIKRTDTGNLCGVFSVFSVLSVLLATCDSLQIGLKIYLIFVKFAVELVSADSTTTSDLDETVCYLDSGDDEDDDDDSDGPLFVEDNLSEEQEEDNSNFAN